jgi:hypothetical protein
LEGRLHDLRDQSQVHHGQGTPGEAMGVEDVLDAMQKRLDQVRRRWRYDGKPPSIHSER